MSNIQLIKVLYPFMKPFKWQIILALILLPLSSIAYSVQPIILQKAVDGPVAQLNLDDLWIYAGALLLAVVINFVLQVVQFLIMNRVGQAMVSDIRFSLFEHLESMSMSFFDRNPVGRSVSRITSDMEQLAESFVAGLVLILLDIFNIVGILFFMFYLNWQLSLIVSLFLIPIYFIAVHYQDLYRKANLLARKELAKLNSFLQQNIIGISVVQVLNSTAKSMQSFAENNRKYFEANDESIKADAQLSALIELISFLAIIALIFISSKLFNSSILTIGIILAFIQYSQSLFEPIRNLSDRFTVVQSAFTAIERMQELLDEPIEIQDKVNTAQAEEKSPLIKFNKVSFQYQNETPVLNEASFEVQQGQKVAIIGRTGSGKSTIIKLLTRLYEADGGCISIAGRDIKDYPQAELREKIAVIHQDSYIFAGDLESNIKLGRDEAKLDMDLACKFLDLAPGLKSERDLLRLGNISAGEEQVINFARALVAKPEILVLDEATAKIDLETEKAIYKLLNEYVEGRTLITIAHRLETIKNADLVLKLEEGELIKQT